MPGDEGDPLNMSTNSTVLGNSMTPGGTPFKVAKPGLQPIPSDRLRSGVPRVGSEVGSPEPGHMGVRMGMSGDAAQQIYDLANVSDMISALRSEKNRLETRVGELSSKTNTQKLELESAAYTRASIESEFENRLMILQASTAAERDVQKITIEKLSDEVRVKDQLLLALRSERTEAHEGEQTELLRLRADHQTAGASIKAKDEAIAEQADKLRIIEEELQRMREDGKKRLDDFTQRKNKVDNDLMDEKKSSASLTEKLAVLAGEKDTGTTERRALTAELSRLQEVVASQATAGERVADAHAEVVRSLEALVGEQKTAHEGYKSEHRFTCTGCAVKGEIAKAQEDSAKERSDLLEKVAGLTKQVEVYHAENHTWHTLQEAFMHSKGALEEITAKLAASENKAAQQEVVVRDLDAERVSLNKAMNINLKMFEKELADAKALHGQERSAFEKKVGVIAAELAQAQMQVKISTGEAAKGEVAQLTLVQLQEENEKLTRKVNAIFQPMFSSTTYASPSRPNTGARPASGGEGSGLNTEGSVEGSEAGEGTDRGG
ncbi:hypothetical protein T484DRAFT_2023463, partial [Baffinella frigidus]